MVIYYMEFCGLQKTSLIDFPGKVSAIIFLGGCNFRCGFCYSSELVLPAKLNNQPRFPKEYVMNFLKERQGQLDGVVICGGEPTINPDLPELIKEIKDMGFLVKLDTNGTNPAMLKSLIESNLIDYAAMDIKGPKEKYSQIAGNNIDINLIQESIDILKNSGLDFEFRTTVVPNFIDQQDIKNMAQWISENKEGQLKYYLQNFFPNKTLDPEFEKLHPYSLSDLKQVQQEISPLFKHCGLRG